MKKQTLWLLVTGNLCIGFRLISASFLKAPESVIDFLTGFGVVLLVGALWVESKKTIQA